MTEILAIIPARGGSKSIPRKNIKVFAGQPLIKYSITSALKTKLINRVIVTTDDPQIRKLALKAGAEASFLRPKRLAQDLTRDLPVFIHTLKWLAKHQNYRPDIVVHLRPTSPLRKVVQIEKAIKLLLKNPKADSVRAVIPASQNPFKMWIIEKNGLMKPVAKIKSKEAYNMPRQALPQAFWQTGYIDVMRTSTILKKHSMTGENILAFVMSPKDWLDLDTMENWLKAEKLISPANNK